MISFKKLAIEGFRSFKTDQVFEFAKTPGFYLIRGENRVEPELGANGAGKSTILEGLCYVLYGKTSRGLRAKEIANRDNDNLTTICVEFEKDGKLYGLTRTWNPNSLILDANGVVKHVEQPEVDDLIGADFDSFLRTVMFSQFATYFFDLTPGAKLLVFSNLLQLDTWDKAVDKAKRLVKELDIAVDREIGYANNAEGVLSTLLDEKVRTTERCRYFQENKDDMESQLNAVLKEQNAAKEKSVGELKLLQESEVEINDRITKLKSRIDLFEKSKAKEALVQKEVEKAITVLQTRAEEVRKYYARINAIKGSCPLCDQEVDKAHKHSIDKFTNEQFETIRSDLDKQVIQLEAVKSKINDLTKRQRECAVDINTYEAALRETNVKKSRVESKIAVAAENVKRTKKDIADLLAKENPYEKALEELKVKFEEAEAKVEFHKGKIKDIKKQVVDCEYWVKGFRDLKFWLVERALTELELYTNNALSELGLSGYKVRFEIERHKTDGSTIRSFQTLITKRGSKEPVVWEAWSGGEIQRIRLAGTIGVSDLISARTGFSCNAEFWDEPTAHLSQEGISDLLSVLSARARLRNKQVWLVDHRTLDAGEFDNVVTVIKDVSGSRILSNKSVTKVLKVKNLKSLNKK